MDYGGLYAVWDCGTSIDGLCVRAGGCMTKKIRKQGFLMVLFSLVLCFAMVGSVPEIQGVTQAEIDALEDKAKEIASAQAELKTQLSALANDMSNAQARKSLIEREILLLEEEIANTEEQITALEGMIFIKVEEIQQAELEERKQYALFCQRVRAMEEAGEVSYWSILFQSSDFSDLLDRIVMIDEIMAYDNIVMDNLIAIRLQIIKEREELEIMRQEQEAIYVQQQQAKAEKQLQEAEVDKLIAQIAAKEEQLAALNRELESAASSMDAQIKQKEKELEALMAAQNNVIVSESGFMWPLPAYDTLSSLFGNRVHPITGNYGSHTGIDIPAPSGTSILAAKSGVVLISEYHYSYGNYVVVSHGNNVTTLYAHMVRRGVSEGDIVSQGGVVGYVGTTGSSTGNHLHYEVRINGTRYDPVNYYPDKALYITYGGVKTRLN